MKRSRDSCQKDLTAFFTQTSSELQSLSKQVRTDASSNVESRTRVDPITSKSTQPRSCIGLDGARHKVGYSTGWEKNHSWLYYVTGEGMYCRLCQKFQTRNRQNQSAVWSQEPCTTLRKDVVTRHEASCMHKEALEQERACMIVQSRGGIREAMQGQAELQHAAVIGAMKCLYWLCKQEIPHTTNYQPLLSLATSLGCSTLSALQVGGNAHYTSERIVHELVEILAEQIESAQLKNVAESPFFGLMVDESTDISVTKQLVLYGRYVSEAGVPCSSFLQIKDLVDGTAERIENAIKVYLSDKGLPFSQLMGFGSDGAAVMTGKVSGVATRLGRCNPYMVAVHCVAHRLALACAQAGEKVPYIKKFKTALSTLYWFFQASSVRTAGLKEIQEVLDSPALKLKEAKDVRWLSHDQAVQNLRRTLAAVLVALEREGSENSEPMAIGLVKVMKCFRFVACLHLMCEVLPHLSHLSRLFQATYTQIGTIKRHLSACIKVLKGYQKADGPDVAATKKALCDQLQSFNITANAEAQDQFNKNVRQPFLQALLENLTDRFPAIEIIDAFGIFDPSSQSSTDTSEEDSVPEGLQTLISYYATGDNAPLDAEAVSKEWESFSVMLADHYHGVKIAKVMQDVASAKLQLVYPQLSRLATIGLTIPFTTAECERAFSTMKRIKTKLRNRLKATTLDSLLRISIEGPELERFDFEQAVRKWSSIRNRRINV